MNKNVNRKFPAPDCLHVTWAAKYLDCTVEDIIRYGAKGDIDLLVNFDECDKPVYGLVTDYTGQNPDNNWLIMLSGGLACYGEAEPTNEPDVVTARLGGVWCVCGLDLNENRLGHPRANPRLFARKDISDRGSSLDGEGKVTEMESPFPDYWITRNDFYLLESLFYVENDLSAEKVGPVIEPVKILIEQVSSLVEKLRHATDQSEILINLLQQAEDEIATLRVKVCKPGYMDPLHPRYTPKLAALIHAWLVYEPNPRKSPKKVLSDWLRDHAEEFTNNDGKPLSGFDDLAAVANWNTRGGAPKTLAIK